MANTKISELTALGATPADDDVLAIVDTSASATKKVTVANLVAAASGFDPDVDNPTIGNGASAGTNSVSIGHDAIGSGASTVLIGQNADGGTNTRATGIGSDVTVSGADATAYGHDARAAAGSTGIGVESRADGSLSTAVGYAAEAKASSSVAIGYNSDCATIAEFSIAIGRQASTANDDAIAIGYLAAGNAVDTTAVGTGAVAGGTSALSIGAGANTNASNAVAIGKNAQATGFASAGVAIGNNSQSLAASAIAIGENAYTYNNNSFGGYAIAIGRDASVEGARGIAIGRGADVSYNSYDSMAIGYNARIADFGHQTSMALGHSALVGASNAIHINASGATTNGPTVDGHMVIETDDAKLEYDGDWTLNGGKLLSGQIEKQYRYDGALAVNTGDARLYIPVACSASDINLYLKTASSSGSVGVDFVIDGTADTSMTIAQGSTSGSGSSTTAISAGSYITFDITSAGTGAEDLYATISLTRS